MHSPGTGEWQQLSVDTIAPIVRRGVLLDVAGALAARNSAARFRDHARSSGPRPRRRTSKSQPGDVVLLRTGWARFWRDAKEYISEAPRARPGTRRSPVAEFAASSSPQAPTPSRSNISPIPAMPVHVHLLVESGIHIMENLNLEQLAAGTAVRRFTFIAAPLRIEGGTGSAGASTRACRLHRSYEATGTRCSFRLAARKSPRT